MNRFFTPRFALALVSLTALAPLAHADEKADAIIKEAELRGRKLNTFAATLTQTDLTTGKKGLKVELKIRRAPTRFLLSGDGGPEGKFAIYQNDKGGFIQIKDQFVKQTGGIRDLPEMWPTLFGTVSAFVGGTKSTKFVTQGTLGDDGHAVDIVDVVGAKKTARLSLLGPSL